MMSKTKAIMKKVIPFPPTGIVRKSAPVSTGIKCGPRQLLRQIMRQHGPAYKKSTKKTQAFNLSHGQIDQAIISSTRYILKLTPVDSNHFYPILLSLDNIGAKLFANNPIPTQQLKKLKNSVPNDEFIRGFFNELAFVARQFSDKLQTKTLLYTDDILTTTSRVDSSIKKLVENLETYQDIIPYSRQFRQIQAMIHGIQLSVYRLQLCLSKLISAGRTYCQRLNRFRTETFSQSDDEDYKPQDNVIQEHPQSSDEEQEEESNSD